MRQIQVLLNATDHAYDDVRASVRLAVGQAAIVDVWGATDEVMLRLTDEFGARVGRAEKIRKIMDVAVVDVDTHTSSASLGLLQKQLDRFLLVRVFDSAMYWNSLALWSHTALEGKEVTVEELINADADFDRRTLPTDSGTARFWVHAVDFGVRNRRPGESVTNFTARVEGTKLRLAAALKSLRGVAGRAKRNRESEKLRQRFYQAPR